MNFYGMIENAFYLLALLNPASKVMFLASCEPPLSKQENFALAWKSSAAALVMLAFLAAAGDFILSRVFRVELYSLQITGGIIVFFIGFTAVKEGRFVKGKTSLSGGTTELSLVPLAAPLIAGPGMIAASIAGSVRSGWISTTISLTAAMLINFCAMIFAREINRALQKIHMLSPLIRLTGLIIAAVAIQMLISGIRTAFGIR